MYTYMYNGLYELWNLYRKNETIDCTRSSKYTIIDEGNIKKLIVRKCTTEDIAEYTATVANVKTSSRLKVEGKFYNITYCDYVFFKFT